MTISDGIFSASSIEPPAMPINHFKGVLKEVNPTIRDDGSTTITLEFGEIEVFQSDSAWDFPTAPLSFPIRTTDDGKLRRNSNYARFLDSLVDITGDETIDIRALKDQQMEMKAVPGSFENDRGETVKFKTWHVVSVAGAEAEVDIETTLLETLDGLNEGDVMRTVMNNPALNKAYQVVMVNGTLLPELVEAGKISIADDGTITVG